MRVFVTGASGYIGGSVAERLVRSGRAVLGLVRSKEKAPLLKERGIDPLVGNLEGGYSPMPHKKRMRSFTLPAPMTQVQFSR